MNVCALDYPDESFNAVLDKGTLDSVLCGEGSTANVAKMCMEISRVLKPNGVYFVCSYGVPDNRLQVCTTDSSRNEFTETKRSGTFLRVRRREKGLLALDSWAPSTTLNRTLRTF